MGWDLRKDHYIESASDISHIVIKGFLFHLQLVHYIKEEPQSICLGV